MHCSPPSQIFCHPLTQREERVASIKEERRSWNGSYLKHFTFLSLALLSSSGNVCTLTCFCFGGVVCIFSCFCLISVVWVLTLLVSTGTLTFSCTSSCLLCLARFFCFFLPCFCSFTFTADLQTYV